MSHAQPPALLNTNLHIFFRRVIFATTDIFLHPSFPKDADFPFFCQSHLSQFLTQFKTIHFDKPKCTERWTSFKNQKIKKSLGILKLVALFSFKM